MSGLHFTLEKIYLFFHKNLPKKTFTFGVLILAIFFSQISVSAAPAISSISPNSGPIEGGTQVTINGTGFQGNSQVTQVASGEYHTCALHTDGNVRCWGSNNFGQLGYGDTTQRNSPGPDINFGGNYAVAIGAGNNHTCAVMNTGSVKCWGWNTFGQLGYGDTVQRNTPGPDINFGTVGATKVAAGRYHTCITTTTSTARCWGTGSNGQLGYGNFSSLFTPGGDINFGGIQISMIDAGEFYTCAMLVTGGARCWGQNSTGQLGYGNTTQRNSPGPDINFNGALVTSISTGFRHTCAVLNTQTARCWGENITGKLGYGDTTQRLSPGPDINFNGTLVNKIFAGYIHTCAILVTGGTRCWGSSTSGMLGYGDGIARRAPANTDINLGGVSAIEMQLGYYSTSTLTATGNVKSWGENNSGQLGYGDTTQRSSPGPDISGLDIRTQFNVTFGGIPASDITFVNSTTVTATTPSHAAGLVNVVLTNGDGTTTSLSNGYTYLSASACDYIGANGSVAVTSTCLAINPGSLTMYAGDSTDDNDLCGEGDTASYNYIQDDGSSVNVTCGLAERSVGLSGVSVANTRQNTTTIINDVLCQDLTGNSNNIYSVSATVGNLVNQGGGNNINLGSNPDGSGLETNLDSDAPTSGDSGKLYATYTPGSSVKAIAPESARNSTVDSNFTVGSKATVINTATSIGVYNTSGGTLAKRFDSDGNTLKYRIPAFPSANSYVGGVTYTCSVS
jgi:alpha-tubulin suppressor-like RCC1 family protein